jgi:hypothetical protein
MARAGPKRKVGAKRYPCGQIKPDDESAVTLAELRRDYLRELRDPLFGSVLGRLYLQDKLTALQFKAANAYQEAVEAYRRVVIGITGRPRSQTFERKSKSSSDHEFADDVIERKQSRYDKLCSAVIALGRDGPAILRTLDQLCLQDEHVAYYELERCKPGLDAIAGVLAISGTVTKFRSRST